MDDREVMKTWKETFHQPDVQQELPLPGFNVIKSATPTNDPVNQPQHYTKGDIECIDAIKAQLGHEGFKAFLHGQVVKYMWRWQHKNGAEDLRKATWYLERLKKEVG